MVQQLAHTGQGDPPQYNDRTVGEILRLTRERYGQRIADIERALNIRAIQLEYIEADLFDRLPGTVYATGFIRSYANYLGLDADRMVDLFKSQSGTTRAKPELHFPMATSESRSPQFLFIGLSALAGLTLISMFWILSSRDRSVVTDVPQVPASIRAEERDVNKLADKQKPAGPPVPQNLTVSEANDAKMPATGLQSSNAENAGKEGIILRIVQNSWVEIKDGAGNVLVSRVLNAGDKYFVPSRPDLYMSLGNSGGVMLEVEGKQLSPLGNSGQVMRNLSLDIKNLKQKYPPKP